MDERAVQVTSQRDALPLGIRVRGFVLCVVGGFAGGSVAVVLLVLLAVPRVPGSGLPWVPLLACATVLAASPTLFGVALLTRRRWALRGADASLSALVIASILVLFAGGLIFVAFAVPWFALSVALVEAASYMGRPSVEAAYRAIAGPSPTLPPALVWTAATLESILHALGGFGLLGLAVGSAVLAIAIQPTGASGWAQMGTEIGRSIFAFLAFVWLGCGVLTLWIRDSAIFPVIGGTFTLLVAEWLLAGNAGLWSALPGSVGLLLLLAAALRMVVPPRDALPTR